MNFIYILRAAFFVLKCFAQFFCTFCRFCRSKKSIDGPSKSLTGPSLLWPLIVAVPHCCGSSLLWSKTLAKLVGFMIRDFSLGNTEVESASEFAKKDAKTEIITDLVGHT